MQAQELAASAGAPGASATRAGPASWHSTTPPQMAKIRMAVAATAAEHGGENATRYGCLEGSRLYGADDATLRLATARGITTQAYAPLGAISNVDVLGRREVQRVAAAHSREGGARNWTAAQVATTATRP